MRRQYFTFNDLLVIVVIIIILFLLAGMFLPTCGSLGYRAYRISCASNLKQIGTTMFMYAGDYNDTFPDECTSKSVSRLLDSTVKGLNLLIEYNYLLDTAIYNCPSTTDYDAKAGNTITTLKTARTCSYSYAPGMMTGASNTYGNADSALVADMTGFMGKRIAVSNGCRSNGIWARVGRLFSTGKSNFGNHDKYGNILFQGMHVKGFTGRNQDDWFLVNYGSFYDFKIQKGSKESSWALTGQYLY